MKYKELINFEPITSVVKLASSSDTNIAESLVKTFVFSTKIKEDIEEIVIKNLIPNPPYETKGIQIVGSYGTGKSHLMAMVAAIAENENYIQCLATDSLKNLFKKIAGHYKVLKFEIGTDKPLKDVLFSHIEKFLLDENVDFTFDLSSNNSWKIMLQQMMSEFESKFPNRHFLIVIDEMLEYLKGRKPTELNNDLMLLRQLGELCDNSRFKIMFGVQEILYRSPEFQFQSEMLNKIEDRFVDLIITKDDVSFVVKERLLKKDLNQKNNIREHLLKFSHLFDGIHNDLNEYVDLFPVHPSYINYFGKIKHGKGQREILKVLSNTFEKIAENDVPNDTPGLITYDTYWNELIENSSMLTFPDIRTVKDKTDIVYDRIKNHFKGARENRKQLAIQICNALAIKILCDDLDKRNGANALSLKEDLCITIPYVDESDLLLAAVESTAKQLLTSTSGQYIDQDPVSSDFYLRTEGGINITQVIHDYADTVIKNDPERADQYYFDFLQYVMGFQQNTYRTGFKIWEHNLNWQDKKSFRLGYIFFGNPNERSTTEPIQQYYIFFCPIFSPASRNDGEDEVYFEMSDLSDEFKDTIYLYGAAKAQETSASSNQKQLFRNQIDENLKKAISLFEKEFVNKTLVVYKGITKFLKSYQLLGEGSSKDMILNDVAARILNKYFNDKFPDYPAFNDLIQPLSKENFDGRIKNALKKIANISIPNRDGEAILSGLGLWNGQNIDTCNSKYAESIKTKLKNQGGGTVLNKTDIIYSHYSPKNLWYSVDFNIDYQLEFIVLAALAYKGDIQITWSQNKTLSATNIESLLTLVPDDYFTYQHIKEPQGLPVKYLKELFNCLDLPDLTSDIEKPDTLTQIITQSKIKVEKVINAEMELSKGLKCRNIPLLSELQAANIMDELDKLHKLLDSIQLYNTFGKLKSFKFTDEELKTGFNAYKYCDLINNLKIRAQKFEKLIGYIKNAQAYIIDNEEQLISDITKTIENLSTVIVLDNDAELKKYETLLISLIDRYAEYYISSYVKYRLSPEDYNKKEKLLNSTSKKLCDIIKDSEFINPAEYKKWLEKVTSLQMIDISLTKNRVKEEPYHNFNPREYYKKPAAKIYELEEQLELILEKWTDTIRSVFKDPSIQENIGLLADNEKLLVENFRDDKIELKLDNATLLRNLINQLANGIDKVEINLEDLGKQINKPVSPNQAIDLFTDYINNQCAGKERNKIRIVIK
ncbi:MAG: DUF6079 family protein [bacterium]